LIEDDGRIDIRRNRHLRIVSLGLISLDDVHRDRAHDAVRDAERLPGRVVVRRMRVEQRHLEEPGLQPGRRLTLETNRGLAIEDSALAVSDQMQVEWSAGREVAGGGE